MYFVKILEDKAGMISINTHLKDDLGFIGIFDLGFLFIVGILHYVHKGSVSTPISVSCQTLEVSPASSELVDLCPNLWCNNSRYNFFLEIFDLHFSFFLSKIMLSLRAMP